MRASVLSILLLLSAAVSFGQARQVSVRGDVGWTGFGDEGGDHALAGASVQVHLTQRFSLQPEFQVLSSVGSFGNNHRDYILIGNAVYDLRSPDKRVIPYLIVGTGAIHSNYNNFSSTEWFITGGFGVKMFIDRHWYVAPDLRIGLEPHARFSVGVGYAWGR